MKFSKGLIGLLVVMLVGLAILVSLWASTYQGSPNTLWGQFLGQLERPWKIFSDIIYSETHLPSGEPQK